MFTPKKRALSHTALAASALAVALFVTGCSDDPKTEASTDVGAGASASPTSPFEKALDYAQCMRSNGVPSFPDPQQDTGGVRISPGDVDPNSSEYQKAEEACRDKMPQGGGGAAAGGGQLDSAKVAEWAKCLRENGLTKLPDPEINGGNMTIDPKAAGITPEQFQKAQQACQDKYPGGGLMLGPGPGQ
ncbi:hypothetical protein [Streptomyces sp. NPDC088794]|jgi:hypothetical protein|uniref:hypothetical protein n=1 Tax=Streptomyces sp. NPDC088794 TaxID=3365902 RepID=UPI0037F8D295